MNKEHTVIIVLMIALVAVSYFYFPSEAFSKKPAVRFGSVISVDNTNEGLELVLRKDIPILIYHSVAPFYPDMTQEVKKYSVEPEMFEQQMRYLEEHDYRVISFEEYLKHPALPKKSVILTFDDGWKNQYTYAWPILHRFRYLATFFVFTNGIGQDHYLSWPQIKEMSAAGMTIGNHTKSHPYLFRITDHAKLYEEIMESKMLLENNLGKTIDIFAYPFGRYSKESIDFLARHGFRAARADGYENADLHTTHGLLTLRGYEIINSMAQFKQVLRVGQ